MSLRCIVVKITLTACLPINKAYPTALNTLGDHLRKYRLDNGLSQPQIAKMFNVSTDTITFWELNRCHPTAKYVKCIIELIGYNPLIKVNMSFGEMLKSKRLEMGLTQEQLSNTLNCDESNLRLIELGKRNSRKKIKRKVLTFIQ